jgi:nucleoside-diphosphate-sugar epimerase
MPVIVVGADSPLGAAIAHTLRGRSGERRAFVSDPTVAERLRADGIKVAVGDVSDASHVEWASLGCFTAVLVCQAASDGREIAFADGPGAVIDGWLRAIREAEVARVIVVGPDQGAHPEVEWAVVDPAGRSPADVAAAVARLDDAARI